MPNLNSKVVTATKWSIFAELVAKLVAPFTNIVLARLLTPETFGIIATITMIISFTEIFSDAGFQKYIVQHPFKDENEKSQCITIAFWSNLFVSLLLWLIIIVFNTQIAELVGNPGLGHVLIIACVLIPIQSFSSIQKSIFQRKLDFKILFRSRIVSTMVPFIITIPLAFFLRSFWALIIGTIIQQILIALLLNHYSQWRPYLYFNWKQLKSMLSFTIWTMVESISIWLTLNLDIFIVGKLLNQHYLGIYKTSMITVNQIMGLIIAIVMPILFSVLSRLQSNHENFNAMFLKMQKGTAVFAFPMGVGIYLFSDFITMILLGGQWKEASGFIAIWGLMSTFTLVFSNFSSEAYRAIGRPKLSTISQFLHIVALIPTVIIAINYGFEMLYNARALVRLEGVFVNILFLKYIIKMPIRKMGLSLLPILCATSIMGFIGKYLVSVVELTALNSIFLIGLCSIIYFLFLYLLMKDEMTRYIKVLYSLVSSKIK